MQIKAAGSRLLETIRIEVQCLTVLVNNPLHVFSNAARYCRIDIDPHRNPATGEDCQVLQDFFGDLA
jgi:hypothetical protein